MPDGAPDPFTTFPEHGTIPGVNDRFDLRPGVNGFFAFNDFNADYWYITGVPVAAAPGGEFLMPKNLLYPGVLNSGQGADKNGVDVPDLQTRVDIRAQKGQTVFLRCLNAAYNSTRYTFPVDVVIIEWDGRALGVPPLNRYTRPHFVPAGTTFLQSTARRFGLLINESVSRDDTVKVEFLDTRSGETLRLDNKVAGDVLMTVHIPIQIV